MRRHRGQHEHGMLTEAEESGELNLIPYLDIITTLVIFLVFTFQVIIEFRLIDLLPPASNATTNNATLLDSEQNITLTLIITREGYVLMTNRPELGTETVPLKPDGTYDTAKLTQTLDRVKTDLKLGTSLILTANDDTEYKTVVAAMDAARSVDNRRLFPDVLLATAHKGGGG